MHPIQEKQGLDLGKPIVVKFARHHLPDDYDKIQGIVSRAGLMPASRICWSTGTPSIGVRLRAKSHGRRFEDRSY